MNQAITIRKAEYPDFEIAFALLVRFFIEEGFEVPESIMQTALEKMLGSKQSAVFLAWENKNAVGIATAVAMDSIEYGRVAEMDDLYVIPEKRGKRIAGELIQAVKKWCRNQDCSTLLVTITPEGQSRYNLFRYYETHGFKNTGRIIFELEIS